MGMKAGRRHNSWRDLRAPAGGVRVAIRPDAREALVRAMRDEYVGEYDAALKSGDLPGAARLAAALRELGVRL